MKTILVPIDFSPVTRRVVDEAVTLADALNARMTLFHSVAPPMMVSTDVAPLAGPILLMTDDIEKGAQKELGRMQRELNERGIEVEISTGRGFPVAAIVEEAKRVAPDYIVIGSHGHTAFYDLVIGGVASGVLKRASCPVVVVSTEKDKAVRRRPTAMAATARRRRR